MKLLKVLYVEDDKLTQIIMKMHLKNLYELDTADNGTNALEMVKKKHYDVILMDINLKSRPNGIEVTQTIKKDPVYFNTPIVAVTAYAQKKEKEYFLSCGLTHYLSKPFRKEQLLSLLKDTLGQ